ncbi:hypothetical protein ACFSNO_30580 [Streptomyces cirratus]
MSARRIPASTITSTAEPAVAIHAPRLNESTSGTVSQRRRAAARPRPARAGAGARAAAAAVATTSP